MASPSLEDRFVGCLLGVLVGDAWGSHFEGLPADMIADRHPTREHLLHELPDTPWRYTDDTQMTIGVAEALIQDGEIIESTLCQAFAENYAPQRRYGGGAHMVIEAIRRGEDHRQLAHNLFPGGSFGNGAAMRVAPVGLQFHNDLERLWQQARLASLPTHVHPLGIEGAQLLAVAVAECLRESNLDSQLLWTTLQQHATQAEFCSKLGDAVQADTPAAVAQLGNGIAALESVVTAVACFLLAPDSFSDVITHAIYLGGDTDTIAAMAGALSGAHLGRGAIPPALLEPIEDDSKGRSYIVDLATQLHARWAG